jgi:hypothetical protein
MVAQNFGLDEFEESVFFGLRRVLAVGPAG